MTTSARQRTCYYEGAYDPALTAIILASNPAGPADLRDHPTVVPARCGACRRIWAKPATATHGGGCWTARTHGPTTCPPCRTRTEQGELW